MAKRAPSTLLVLTLVASGCNAPDQFLPTNQSGGPAGVLGGSLTYNGPLPCTEGGHVLGAAVLLAFDTRLLPPPDGLGTSAASLAVVPGDTLFGSMVDRLTFQTDGSRWCPDPSAPAVTAAADWGVGPLSGGEYEVRGFYDLHGQFDPAFSISKLPHQGDVAGGAIDNVSAVLMGAAPIYRRITLGTPDGKGGFDIPPQGANIEGVAVTLGLVLPEGLPIFYASDVSYSMNACVGGKVKPATPKTKDPNHVTMPSDYTLPVFTSDPTMAMVTEDSIIRVTLSAGVPASEVATATASPYDLPVTTPPPGFAFQWQDVNGDGMLDIMHDHVAASSILPSLLPLSLFTKLAASSPPSPLDDLTPQASPAVIIQGLTLYKNLTDTFVWQYAMPPTVVLQDTAVIVGVTPAALCLDPTDFSPGAKAKLVVTHLNDCKGNPILSDPKGTLEALSKQFGRTVEAVEACLPQGRYAMNLVYGTGQAWSVPDEAGVCQALEMASKDPTMCAASGTAGAMRKRLLSQDVVLTVGPPDDPSYCAQPAHKTPPECCPKGVCP